MKRTFFMVLGLFVALCVEAQNLEEKVAGNSEKIVLSGTVRDERSGAVIAQASVSVVGSSVSVVTNEDGFFTLKADRMPNGINVSHIGYQSRHLTAREAMKSPLNIKLKATAIALHEVVVWTGDPSELVRIAVRNNDNHRVLITLLKNGFHAEPTNSWWEKPLNVALEFAKSIDIIKVLISGGAIVDDSAMRKARDLPMGTKEQQKYRNQVIDVLTKAKKKKR